MTDTEVELLEIKETLKRMQAHINLLEDRINKVNPQCYWSTDLSAIPDSGLPLYSLDYPLSLSAARSLYPMLEHEFDEYCMRNKLTVWKSTDSLDFYNKYIGLGADFPETFNDVQNR